MSTEYPNDAFPKSIVMCQRTWVRVFREWADESTTAYYALANSRARIAMTIETHGFFNEEIMWEGHIMFPSGRYYGCEMSAIGVGIDGIIDYCDQHPMTDALIRLSQDVYCELEEKRPAPSRQRKGGRRGSGRHVPADWPERRAAVFERDDYTCTYCGKRGGRLECDHKVPVSRGGGHDPSNLTTACYECNRSKRDKTVEEWRAKS